MAVVELAHGDFVSVEAKDEVFIIKVKLSFVRSVIAILVTVVQMGDAKGIAAIVTSPLGGVFILVVRLIGSIVAVIFTVIDQ